MTSAKATYSIDSLLGRLHNILLLNAGFSKDIGLNGRLGVAIFYFLASKYRKNGIYETYANELLDSISSLPKDIGIGFNSGLIGIGYGINFLNKSKFIAIDANEILEVVDNSCYAKAVNLSAKDINTILQITSYLTSRISDTKKNAANYYLLAENLIVLINKISEFVYENKSLLHIFYLQQVDMLISLYDCIDRLLLVKINTIELEEARCILEESAFDSECAYGAADYFESLKRIYLKERFNFCMQPTLCSSMDSMKGPNNFYRDFKSAFFIQSFNSSLRKKILGDLSGEARPDIGGICGYYLDNLYRRGKTIDIGLTGLAGLGSLLSTSHRKINCLVREFYFNLSILSSL